ncbi:MULTISPECIES: ferredoxin [unclassified Frankia]|uniref:ferredoxin n=1 Tax=unclassified Frankia TaxID=2632575 RepID=UPI002024BDA1
MTYVIGDACVDVKDNSCVKECPVDCIYEGDRSMYINPTECIDCGACEAVCPVRAISADVDLPGELLHLAARAEALFAEIGDPGGARRHGPLNGDHPAIAAMPPKSATA